MSENLEVVRSIYAAWERGDYSSAEWAHPEIVYAVADGPDPGSWTGLTGMAEAARDRLRMWDEYHQKVNEFRELDAKRVLVLLDRSGSFKTTGLDLEQMQTEGAHVVHVCGGRVTRIVAYWDRDRAFADLGLTE